MEFNVSTFILEIINFLILIWILQRLFYKPLLEVIAKRKQFIDQSLADAKAMQQQAEEQRSLYENRQKLWEQEKQAALAALHQQIDAERRTQMARLDTDLEQERQKINVTLQRQQQELQRQLVEALDGAVKATGLPDYEGTRRAIAAEMLKLPDSLPPNERALQAAQRLKVNGDQAVLSDSIKLLKENPVEKIAELAPDVLEKIRQWEIERINKEKALKQQSIAAAKTSKDSIKQPRRGPAQKVVSSTGFRDFFESR